jgi:hypothetical protein
LHFYSGKPKFIKGGTILALPHTEAPYTLSNFILSGKVEVSITLRAVTEEGGNVKIEAPFQPDLELCIDIPKCWRFERKNATICSNCPHVNKKEKA